MTDLVDPCGTFSTSSDAFIKASLSYLHSHHAYSVCTIPYRCIVDTKIYVYMYVYIYKNKSLSLYIYTCVCM